jgi:hypothetical protein
MLWKVSSLDLFRNDTDDDSFEVNSNWMRFDPWFMVRMYFKHFGHPMSPLSSTKLVKQAFFCDAYPMEKVVEFEKRMPRMEVCYAIVIIHTAYKIRASYGRWAC